ncbi:MAG: hypothetical protein R8P61_24805 [Bacteroidia bacterium]|nr:hypothetical protein [Bacteroidia bacterium]
MKEFLRDKRFQYVIAIYCLLALAFSVYTSNRVYELQEQVIPLLNDKEYEQAEEVLSELEGIIDNYIYQPKFFPDKSLMSVAKHKLHTGKGRLALKAKQLEEAKEHLLNSAKISGAPTLNSFGPNMSLAQKLIEEGESEVVLTYFELCGEFWKNKFDKTDLWKEAIENGEMPDFGSNLIY